MEELEERIYSLLSKGNKKYTYSELKNLLSVKGEGQTTIFDSALYALLEDGSLFFNDKNQIQILSPNTDLCFGTIRLKNVGHGWVTTKDGYSIYVPQEEIHGALDGDSVIVKDIEPYLHKKRKGKVDKIVKRKSGKLLVELIKENDRILWKPYRSNQLININIPKHQLKNMFGGEIVEVIVGKDSLEGTYPAEIERVIGYKNDLDISLKALTAEFDVPVEFSKEAHKQASLTPQVVLNKELDGRTDFTSLPFITIDCDTTKDRDDSIYLTKMDNGHYQLWVSIADVAHYVPLGSPIYEEAKKRGTSHYFKNKCIPQIPRELSNGICSLEPNVIRLSKTIQIELDESGHIINEMVFPKSYICSRKAMKYSEVNRVLAGENVEGYEEYQELLFLLEELSEKISKIRKEKNYLDFQQPDIEISENDLGKVDTIHTSYQGKAEKIIENAMIIANISIASRYSWLPFIYRIHESPDKDSIKNAVALISNEKTKFKITSYDSVGLAKLLQMVDKTEASPIFRKILLKAMKKAKYSIMNCGHFALQEEYYCHFTSPIRRLPDLRIQLLIDQIESLDYQPETIKLLEEELASIAAISSSKEKIAMQLEKEANKMAMAEYMQNHIGETFALYVTGVYPNEMTVSTMNMIPGGISIKDMEDDYYQFDGKRMCMIGRKYHKTYHIGDKIYAIAKSASVENRTIDFKIEKQKVKTMANNHSKK